jgi:N,N'-diacetyllegionaminate synthase
MEIKIGNKWIGEDYPTFVIAEGGINHNGELKLAKKIIDKAKNIGADAIKFQTFKANDLTSTKSNYYKLFKKLELTEENFIELSCYAKKRNIIFLSTPFSNNAIDLLEKLNVPAFKIASGDLTNIPLIEYASTKNKPMIISTGMSNLNEIRDAIRAIKKHGNNKIILMHSISSYPTPYNDVNLKVIKNLKNEFPYTVGFSDNGDDSLVPIISVAMGAKIIEKHFTVDKKLSGPDQKLSADPVELKNIIQNIRKIEKMMGDGIKKCRSSESVNLIEARRSITAKKEILRGEKIEMDFIDFKRPATGISPKFIKKVLGKTVKKKIKIDESIKWNDLS